MMERTTPSLRTIELDSRQLFIRELREDDSGRLCAFVNRLSAENTFVRLSGEVIEEDNERIYVLDSLKLVNTGQKVHLVVEHNNEIVGNAEIRPNGKRQEHVGTVTIAIDQSVRGKGIGTELMRSLIDEARKIGFKLLVLSSMHINHSGRAVYEKVGFKEVGIIPKAFLYKDKYIDEVVYFLDLEES